MEKKNLSAVDISKKLIWEYIIASFIFGIISYFIIGFSTRNMENTTEKMILQINEYEVYNKAGRRVSADDYWAKLNDFTYKKVDYSKIKLEIKRMDKVLYSGDYIADISNYLNENGRYYIHIYMNRKDGWFSGVKTHFSFNVIVGDEYEK